MFLGSVAVAKFGSGLERLGDLDQYQPDISTPSAHHSMFKTPGFHVKPHSNCFGPPGKENIPVCKGKIGFGTANRICGASVSIGN